MGLDDDILTGLIPDPDAEPTASERAHAKTFADLVEKTLAGKTPPAMSADDRALLEVATVIRAATGKIELGTSKARSLVDDVLRQRVGEPAASASIQSIAVARAKRKWVPWAVAGVSSAVAAAAVLVLMLRAPQRVTVVEAPPLPTEWTSRPADALIGPIAADQSGDADARLDRIFDDRMDGYRDRLVLRGGRR
jgi:hypothetical protein